MGLEPNYGQQLTTLNGQLQSLVEASRTQAAATLAAAYVTAHPEEEWSVTRIIEVQAEFRGKLYRK